MPTSDGFSEQCEKTIHNVEARHYQVSNTKEQAMLEQLLATGFRWNEAITLLMMRENLCENAEMRQRMLDDHRMHFAQWLYKHGIVGEG